MAPKSVARLTLEKARFFVDQAESAGVANRLAQQNNLEAAIVFGRSVTFHIQKEFAHHLGFDPWYAVQQKAMKADPLLDFFLATRNYILKEGPVALQRTIQLSASGEVHASGYLEVHIIRGRPWYRRSPAILWADLVADIGRPIARWRWIRQQARVVKMRLAKQNRQTVEVRDLLHFEQSPFNDRQALDLLRDYLDKLESIVNEAEEIFASNFS